MNSVSAVTGATRCAAARTAHLAVARATRAAAPVAKNAWWRAGADRRARPGRSSPASATSAPHVGTREDVQVADARGLLALGGPRARSGCPPAAPRRAPRARRARPRPAAASGTGTCSSTCERIARSYSPSSAGTSEPSKGSIRRASGSALRARARRPARTARSRPSPARGRAARPAARRRRSRSRRSCAARSFVRPHSARTCAAFERAPSSRQRPRRSASAASGWV